MIYGSVCSGIEAATVAWHPLGWKAAWYSEIEKFPSAVLKHHYPNTPNLGDMTRLHEQEEFKSRPIDLLIGGTPCQAFSLAGYRKGLSDGRGALSITFCNLVEKSGARWAVWENVPGVLSSTDNSFGCFLAGLSGSDDELRSPIPGGGGPVQVLCLDQNMDWPGASSTPNFSEFPNRVSVSLLSDILETGDVPQRLFLKPGNMERLAKTKFRSGLEIVYKCGSILGCLKAGGERYKVGFLLEI